MKRLKNIEKSLSSNNNDKSTLSNARSESSSVRSESSSARSESSKKTSVSDDVSNNLEPKNETKTSFEYLKNNNSVVFFSYPNIFDSDLTVA